MAGDIVTRLKMDYAQYQAGCQAGIRSNQMFEQSVTQMRNRLDDLQKTVRSAENFRQGNQGFAVAKWVQKSEMEANVSGMSANNRMQSAMLSDQASQHLRLATAIEQERAAALSAQGALQLLSHQEKSAAFQAESAKASHSRLTLAIHQDRQATRLLAETKRLLEGDLKQGIITAKEYKQAMASMTAGQAMMARGSGRAQLAISQMIFAVDDAATVYGTAGLSGAIRAASNNLTMMAGLLGGPWALGASVAIAAAVQLGMVLFRSSDGAKAAKDSLNDMTSALNRQAKAIEYHLQLEAELKKLRKDRDAETGAKSIGDLKERQKALKAEEDLLMSRASVLKNEIRESQQPIIQQSPALTAERWLWNKIEYATASVSAKVYGMDRKGDKESAAKALKATTEKLSEVTQERLKNEREIQQRMENQVKVMKEMLTLSQGELFRGFFTQAKIAFGLNVQDRDKNAADAAGKWREMQNTISDQLDPSGRKSQQRGIAQEFADRKKWIRENIADDAMRRSMITDSRRAAVRQLSQVGSMNDSNAGRGPSAAEKGSREAMEVVRQGILASMNRTIPQQNHEKTLENLLKQINENGRKANTLAEKMRQMMPTPAGVN